MAQERSEVKRAAFRVAMAGVPLEKLVFLDECGFSLNLIRLYGWVQGGGRCHEVVPFQRGKNCSVIGAFSLSSALSLSSSSAFSNGLRALRHHLGTIKRNDVEGFLEESLLPVLEAGSVLVMDNARTHHGGKIAELVEKAGCSLLYLPPYSPDLSPIELVWSWLKAQVKRMAPRDNLARTEAIVQAAQLLPDHSAASFKHCGYEPPFSD